VIHAPGLERTQDFDELVVVEDLLIENLPSTSEVDGHDFGSDEFNIFVLTDQPRESLRVAEKIIQQRVIRCSRMEVVQVTIR
jgi:hypothetical protein